MICSECEETAIITQHIYGRRLCKNHFLEDFERRVAQTVQKNEMIKDKERIAIALSGGKDSSALLLCLKHILIDKDVELVAITVDEGIAGYREDTIKSARSIARNLDIGMEIVSFRDEYGCDLDQMKVGPEKSPCTYCGVFRKSALNRIAKAIGADKVATGHNLDDEAQSIVMNYLKGDIERLFRSTLKKRQPGLVPRIKPLKEMLEKEVALYAFVNGIFAQSPECPYASLSLRSDIRKMTNEIESHIPGTKQAIMHGFSKLDDRSKGKWNVFDLSACELCHEPCAGKICKTCELKRNIF